jgi:hypothetical protein
MATDALHFQVRSSSSDQVYDIEARFSPTLKITCTCQGGLMGQICKHRTALLLENPSSIIDLNLDDLRSLSRQARESPLGNAIQEMSDLEIEADKLKKQISAYKKKISRLMNGEAPSKAAYAARY